MTANSPERLGPVGPSTIGRGNGTTDSGLLGALKTIVWPGFSLADYAPDDSTRTCSRSIIGSGPMNGVWSDALQEMFEAEPKEGLKLAAVS